MPTETIESKEMYRGFIALRLATCSTVGTTIKPPRAVDAGYPQPRDLRGPEPCRKAVISAARLFRLDTDSETRTTSSALRTAGADAQARTGSARNLLAERDVEEAQGADDLVEA